jgi:RND family efflux transporter MFP subunit
MTLRLSSLILAAPVILLGCSQSNQPTQASPPTAQAQLVKASEQQIPRSIPLTGTVHAKETATISAQVPGNIRRVWVQAGDRVHAGQLLVTLDDAGMRAGLDRALAAQAAVGKQQMAARTNASLAANTLTRYQMLKQEKSVSPQEFDQVQKQSQVAALQVQALQAQGDEAKAAVAGAKTQFSYTQVRAPFAGVVTARMADPGTLAAPGVPLLQLDSDGPLQLYTSVDESLIGSIRTGMKIPLSIDGIGASAITGTVAQIVPAADPASRTFLLKLDLPSIKELRAGMYGTAHLPGAVRPAILAPQSAVVMRGSLACVYALDQNGVAQLRYITLGNRHGDNVEVLSGLSAGETLVNDPGDRDLAGKRILENSTKEQQ